MEKTNLYLFFLICLLSANTFAFAAADWCIAQPSAPEDKLQAFIDYGCGVADCAAIQAGAPCFDPNTVMSHASYALNSVYKQLGSCNTDVGNITTTDPSYGGCKYP